MKQIFYALAKLFPVGLLTLTGATFISIAVTYFLSTGRINFSLQLLFLSSLITISSYVLSQIRRTIDEKYKKLKTAQGDALTNQKRKALWRSACSWETKFRPTLVIGSYLVLSLGIPVMIFLMANNYNSEPSNKELLELEKTKFSSQRDELDSVKRRINELEDSIRWIPNLRQLVDSGQIESKAN